MRIELRVDRKGEIIFRAECDTERGSSFAEFSKLALREFNQRHPEVSLLDDDVWLKFDRVRCPETPKTGTIVAQCHMRVLRHPTPAGIPSNAISLARVSAMVGESGLTDSCVSQRQRRWS